MKDLSQDIMDTIKKEHITPLPKWHFVLHRSFIWAIFVFCVLLGGLAVSSIIFHVNDLDMDIYSRYSDNFFDVALKVIPYFWVILMCIFVFAAYYNFKHTDGGYKYGTFLIVLASLLGSLLVGLLIYYVDANETIEENVMSHIPMYNLLMPPKENIWNRPEKGLITGKIMIILNDKDFRLQAKEGEPWIVDYTNATWLKGTAPVPGLRVKMLGEKDGPFHFTALEIRPWFKERPMRPIMHDLKNELKNPERNILGPAY